MTCVTTRRFACTRLAWLTMATGLIAALAVARPDAQSTLPPFGTGTAAISGTVVDAITNQPVAQVDVHLFRDNTQSGPRVTTGANGGFRFVDLPAVPVKQAWQQDWQSVHRIRSALMRERVAVGNAIRGLLGEYGIVIAKG